MSDAISNEQLKLMDKYWRAANYLSVGQIYLYDNPLLRKPLHKEHIKPRLLGHWGTTPGLNFGGNHLPLNIDDWTLFTIGAPNTTNLINTLGFLDANGAATAILQVAADPSLIGIRADHCYVILSGGMVQAISNAVGLDLVP